MAEKPATAKFIVDRPVYHTPGKPPHAVGSEQEFPTDDVGHLIEAGFIHRKGADPLPTAVAVGQQQISQPQAPQTVAPAMPAAPQNYQTQAFRTRRMINFDTLVLGPCLGVFGEPIHYRTVALPGQPPISAEIAGVFDEPTVEQFELDGFKPGRVINTAPLLGVQLSQFAAFGIVAAQDDVLTRGLTGRTYQVALVVEDGLGGAVLHLNNAFDMPNPP